RRRTVQRTPAGSSDARRCGRGPLSRRMPRARRRAVQLSRLRLRVDQTGTGGIRRTENRSLIPKGNAVDMETEHSSPDRYETSDNLTPEETLYSNNALEALKADLPIETIALLPSIDVSLKNRTRRGLKRRTMLAALGILA